MIASPKTHTISISPFRNLLNSVKSIDYEDQSQVEIVKKMHSILKVLNFGSKGIGEHKIDLDLLRNMCVSKHGLINSDIRRVVWPILLNAEIISGKDISSLSDDNSWLPHSQIKHKESEQIAKDINRSLNSFNECKAWTKELKTIRRQQLSNMITSILNQNPSLYYY